MRSNNYVSPMVIVTPVNMTFRNLRQNRQCGQQCLVRQKMYEVVNRAPVRCVPGPYLSASHRCWLQ